MNEAISIVDKASAQSDRWLFVAALVLGGLFFWRVLQYLVKQHEALIADHKEARQKHETALQNIVTQQNETTRTVAVAMDRNTVAMEENTAVIKRLREDRII